MGDREPPCWRFTDRSQEWRGERGVRCESVCTEEGGEEGRRGGGCSCVTRPATHKSLWGGGGRVVLSMVATESLRGRSRWAGTHTRGSPCCCCCCCCLLFFARIQAKSVWQLRGFGPPPAPLPAVHFRVVNSLPPPLTYLSHPPLNLVTSCHESSSKRSVLGVFLLTGRRRLHRVQLQAVPAVDPFLKPFCRRVVLKQPSNNCM